MLTAIFAVEGGACKRVLRVGRALLVHASLVLAIACSASDAPVPDAPRANLLLVTLDTTRADRLGLYGYTRPTSPNLDRLAQRSIVYTRAYSTSSWTLPAHASLFTGKLPTSHGAHYDPEGPLVLSAGIDSGEALKPGMRRALARLGYGTLSPMEIRARSLAADESTLAETLRSAGYETAAVVGGPWLKQVFGLARGFEHHDAVGVTTASGRPATSVSDAAIDFLEARRDGPFFLFLNYFDPHRPFAPPENHRQPFLPDDAEGNARYDGEIRYVDAELARVLAWLEEREIFDDTLIVITADHGELLGEHGLVGHGNHLYEELIRVPLLVKPAGNTQPRREDARILIADLHAMMLRRLGLAHAGPRVPHPIIAETSSPDARHGALRSLVDGRHKLVWSSRGDHQLFDLERDPRETENLAEREPERTLALEAQLSSHLAGLPRPGPPAQSDEVDSETRHALEALGYLTPSAAPDTE